MAERMPRSLSSLWLPLPMLPVIGGRGNHPGSQPSRGETGNRCEHGLSNTDTGEKSLLASAWPVQLQTTALLLQTTSLPSYSQLHPALRQSKKPASKMTQAQMCRLRLFTHNVTDRAHLQVPAEGIKATKTVCAVGCFHGLCSCLTVKGNCPAAGTHTISTPPKQKTISKCRQASFLCSHCWSFTAVCVTQKSFSLFQWCASFKTLHSRGRTLSHFYAYQLSWRKHFRIILRKLT